MKKVDNKKKNNDKVSMNQKIKMKEMKNKEWMNVAFAKIEGKWKLSVCKSKYKQEEN